MHSLWPTMPPNLKEYPTILIAQLRNIFRMIILKLRNIIIIYHHCVNDVYQSLARCEAGSGASTSGVGCEVSCLPPPTHTPWTLIFCISYRLCNCHRFWSEYLDLSIQCHVNYTFKWLVEFWLHFEKCITIILANPTSILSVFLSICSTCWPILLI